jgi:hypothetical protein
MSKRERERESEVDMGGMVMAGIEMEGETCDAGIFRHL